MPDIQSTALENPVQGAALVESLAVVTDHAVGVPLNQTAVTPESIPPAQDALIYTSNPYTISGIAIFDSDPAPLAGAAWGDTVMEVCPNPATNPSTPDLGVENLFSVLDGSGVGSGMESLTTSDSHESEDKGSDSVPKTIRRKKARSKRRSQLKWDYSDSLELQTDGSPNSSHESANLSSNIGNPTEPSLSSIFESIRQFQGEVRLDSLAAKGATKKLHSGIRKLNKICTDIGDWLVMVEGRTPTLESEVTQVKEQGAAHEACLADLMAKLEEQENRSRRNNLRLLGIPEGVEGGGPQRVYHQIASCRLPNTDQLQLGPGDTKGASLPV